MRPVPRPIPVNVKTATSSVSAQEIRGHQEMAGRTCAILPDVSKVRYSIQCFNSTLSIRYLTGRGWSQAVHS